MFDRYVQWQKEHERVNLNRELFWRHLHQRLYKHIISWFYQCKIYGRTKKCGMFSFCADLTRQQALKKKNMQIRKKYFKKFQSIKRWRTYFKVFSIREDMFLWKYLWSQMLPRYLRRSGYPEETGPPRVRDLPLHIADLDADGCLGMRAPLFNSSRQFIFLTDRGIRVWFSVCCVFWDLVKCISLKRKWSSSQHVSHITAVGDVKVWGSHVPNVC